MFVVETLSWYDYGVTEKFNLSSMSLILNVLNILNLLQIDLLESYTFRVSVKY